MRSGAPSLRGLLPEARPPGLSHLLRILRNFPYLDRLHVRAPYGHIEAKSAKSASSQSSSLQPEATGKDRPENTGDFVRESFDLG